MKTRKRKCKHCGTQYQPFNSMQKACSVPCAAALGRAAKERKDRQRTAEAKQRLKSRSDWLREAQAAFNSYIRERDRGKPCISCGKPDNGRHQRHASHYRSVGACKVLRFNTYNVHASCAQCNSFKSGNITEYRIALVRLLGAERVEWLESQNQPAEHSIEYANRIKKIFTRRAKNLKKRYNR